MRSKQSRRTFLQNTVGTSGAIAIVGLLPAAAAPHFILKYASSLADTHPLNVRVREAAASIMRETKGRVELKMFTNGQMGGDTDMLSQIRAGGIDFFPVPGAILSTLVPVAAIDSVGFALKSYAQVWAAMDGELGGHIRGAIAKTGLVVMERIWDNGFRQITSSSRAIKVPADLKGFKIRVLTSTLWTSMFKALGAAPTSINFNEVYSALQTKVVEGQENPLAIIKASRFNEVQKYCSLSSHIWSGFWFLSNGGSWARLPADVREIVARHVNAAALAQRRDVAALNANLETELTAHGLAFNRPDPHAFQTALRKAGFYAEWRGKYGEVAWSLLEKYAGKLA
ncbi:TRAP transporter substrate-binding protein [Duganella sp. Dugasp56]|uniref:TRAP transporter substrate-binding protein n=1 Tax=Duganella sp. Dugasp56 TaxID=3243046 RepID=UPI0039B0270B